jgi:hypothetical protein
MWRLSGGIAVHVVLLVIFGLLLEGLWVLLWLSMLVGHNTLGVLLVLPRRRGWG